MNTKHAEVERLTDGGAEADSAPFFVTQLGDVKVETRQSGNPSDVDNEHPLEFYTP
jgi:hypothetical protein